MFKVLVLQTLYTLSDDQTESAEGPAVVHAVYRAGPARRGAGRQDDLALPRAVGASRRGRALVRTVRRGAAGRGWLAMGGQIVDARRVRRG
jgi:hypothetical protein